MNLYYNPLFSASSRERSETPNNLTDGSDNCTSNVQNLPTIDNNPSTIGAVSQEHSRPLQSVHNHPTTSHFGRNRSKSHDASANIIQRENTNNVEQKQKTVVKLMSNDEILYHIWKIQVTFNELL